MKQPVFHQTLLEQLECQDPDVVALLEVKLQCNGEDTWTSFYEPIEHKYEAYMSLCDKKYSGTVVLQKRSLAIPEAFYDFGDSKQHNYESRFINLDFKDLSVANVYVPFKGAGDPAKLLRRQE